MASRNAEDALGLRVDDCFTALEAGDVDLPVRAVGTQDDTWSVGALAEWILVVVGLLNLRLLVLWLLLVLRASMGSRVVCAHLPVGSRVRVARMTIVATLSWVGLASALLVLHVVTGDGSYRGTNGCGFDDVLAAVASVVFVAHDGGSERGDGSSYSCALPGGSLTGGERRGAGDADEGGDELLDSIVHTIEVGKFSLT